VTLAVASTLPAIGLDDPCWVSSRINWSQLNHQESSGILPSCRNQEILTITEAIEDESWSSPKEPLLRQRGSHENRRIRSALPRGDACRPDHPVCILAVEVDWLRELAFLDEGCFECALIDDRAQRTDPSG
jgi:hypothetical protein